MLRLAKRVGAAVAAALVVLLLYGTFVEPRLILDQRRYQMPIPELAAEWSGVEIAVFSDLQIGMWLANIGMIEQVVDAVLDADPDVVLMPGDFLYSDDPPPAAQADAATQLLAPLTEAGIPTFAVLGNHDYASGGAEEITAALERRGVDVLRNEAVALRPAGGTGGEERLYIVGVGAKRFGHSDPHEALRGVPQGAPRVVMMHNPASFPALPPHSAPLAVAGHTHCGQISIPGLPLWSYLALRSEERVVADGFPPRPYGAAGNRLFVTCGIGFSLVPIRINAAPQVVIFELTAG